MYMYMYMYTSFMFWSADNAVHPPGENQNFAVDFSGSDGRSKSIGDTVRVVSIRFVSSSQIMQ